MSNIKFYRCKVCGNIMVLLLNSGAAKECCERTMEPVEPNTTDASKETHVPVVTKDDGTIHVSVGSTPHPMVQEHYIECIAMDAGNKTEILYLAPGLEPKADFAFVASGTVYAYCNVHGLWEAKF